MLLDLSHLSFATPLLLPPTPNPLRPINHTLHPRRQDYLFVTLQRMAQARLHAHSTVSVADDAGERMVESMRRGQEEAGEAAAHAGSADGGEEMV